MSKDYPLFQPERPEMFEGGCNPPPKPHHHHHHECDRPIGPSPSCPPGYNPHFNCIPPVPPVPSPIEGSSLYEQMGVLTERVNVCINQWNSVSKNCYEALNQVVQAARSNDVYYDDCEVGYQEGYDEVEGAAYAIVEKKAVDRKGEPIFVKLYPAYKNTSNPGVKQKIFDASFINSANVIITAVPATSNTWTGPALINGAGMPGTAVEDSYVYGFTRKGSLRYFPSNVSETTLCQQGMVDVIGGCVPILYDGKVLDEVVGMTEREAVTAIGFNSGTGSVFFFACSAQNEPGMGIASVARVLQGYGCTTAVVTSHQVNNKEVTTSEGMLYLGNMTCDPAQAIQPENLAYWVVTKMPCFHNRFEKEIADLVQTTGRNAWETYLLGVQIQSFDDRIASNTEAIKAEVERAMQAEAWLQENINKEVNRAMQAEAWLQENINKEVDRAKEAESALDNKIEAETTRATTAEAELSAKIQEEQLRAMEVERDLSNQILKEIQDRITADNKIIQSIEDETQSRIEAINNLKVYVDEQITNLTEEINKVVSGQVNLPYLKLTGGFMTGDITMATGTTVVLGRGPIAATDAATKKYVDDAIASGTTPGGDVTKEYVDQQIAVVQTNLDNKVSKTGDSMSGSLDMDGNKIISPVLSSPTPIQVNNGGVGQQIISGVAVPSRPYDAANKRYVDEGIESASSSIAGDLRKEFLPLSGGTMTGNIAMSGSSEIRFTTTDQVPPTLKIDDSNGDANITTTGGLQITGTNIHAKNNENKAISISGIKSVHVDDVTTPGYTVTENNGLNVIGGFSNFLVDGQNYAPIGSGTHNIYNGSTMAGSIIPHNGHIDISVNDSAGSVYINRANTAGGTGEIWVSEVHSPQQLILRPGSSISANNANIRNVKDPDSPQDAVTLNYLKNNFVPIREFGRGHIYLDELNVGPNYLREPDSEIGLDIFLTKKETGVLYIVVRNNDFSIIYYRPDGTSGTFPDVAISIRFNIATVKPWCWYKETLNGPLIDGFSDFTFNTSANKFGYSFTAKKQGATTNLSAPFIWIYGSGSMPVLEYYPPDLDGPSFSSLTI